MSVQKDELSSLTVRLASPTAFQQANIQYSPALVGVRLSIEKRADGAAYIKIVSSRPVSEPFIELLVELSWAQGRLVRQYSALIDPPDFAQPPAPSVTVAPPASPASQPVAPAPQPIAAAPEAAAPALATEPPAAARSKVAIEGNRYTIKRGDTLSKIAAGAKPEGVTLEQMLVSLYRANPDAFVGNMSRMKAGKILRIPEREQLAEPSQRDAVKEVRVQAANWRAYRQKLAEAAGTTPAQETKSAASGKITTAVEDKAAPKEAPKEVLKLSKGEPVAGKGKGKGGKPMSDKDRMRMLEEEVTAREKALAEANERVVQLEKSVKDMQRLLEIKGQPPVGKPAPGAKPEPTPPAKAGQDAKTEAAKAPPAKGEPTNDMAKAATQELKGEQKAAPAEKPVAIPLKSEAPTGEPPKAEAPKAEAPKAAQEQPKPKPKIVAPPPPPPEPDLVDQLLGNALYLGGGLLVVLLVGGGYLFVRRRRSQAGDEGGGRKTAPKLKGEAVAATVAISSSRSAPAAAPAPAVDDVDPLAEADLYLNFGRDAQAEEVLKEALGKNPKNEAAQLKLLQIYAGRKDKAAFEKAAHGLHTQTGGAGDNWLKAAAMGYALDAGNALYDAGKSAPAAALPTAAGAANLDFDLEVSSGAAAAKPDVELDTGGASDKTAVMRPGELAGAAVAGGVDVDITRDSGGAHTVALGPKAAAPDFTLNLPGGAPDIAAGQQVKTPEPAAPAGNMVDFNFDTAAAAKPAAPALVPDFKLDLGGDAAAPAPAAPLMPELKLDDINLSLDDSSKTVVTKAAGAEGGAKDDRWYDVQTKFDLAKAYQEMGDKDGARDILQEVMKEGDAGQQAEAKKLLATLG